MRVFFIILLSIGISCNTLSSSNINDKEKVISNFKDFVNELISQRLAYRSKLTEIAQIDVTNLSFIKDIQLLKSIKKTISQQREIDAWNHNQNRAIYSKWNVIFSKIEKETSDIDILNFCKSFFGVNIDNDKSLNELINKENNYLDSYEKYIDFLIAHNENIMVINNEIIMNDQKLIDDYVIFSNDYNNNETNFFTSLENFKILRINNLKVLNKIWKIEEIDNFIKIMEE